MRICGIGKRGKKMRRKESEKENMEEEKIKIEQRLHAGLFCSSMGKRERESRAVTRFVAGLEPDGSEVDAEAARISNSQQIYSIHLSMYTDPWTSLRSPFHVVCSATPYPRYCTLRIFSCADSIHVL